jgi:hypothetical protein
MAGGLANLVCLFILYVIYYLYYIFLLLFMAQSNTPGTIFGKSLPISVSRVFVLEAQIRFND